MITVQKEQRKDKIKLSNLTPATNYPVSTTILVPAEFGGKGDPASSIVCTGLFTLHFLLYSILYSILNTLYSTQ